jgi:hypothetical protein
MKFAEGLITQLELQNKILQAMSRMGQNAKVQ